MTYQDLRSILIKSTSGEHGIYVFRLFEFVYGEVNPTKELNEKHVDDFLNLAINLASLKTHLNTHRNGSKTKQDISVGFCYKNNPEAKYKDF